jgi:peptidoglycan/xylan/chitin deacetylase (PgdA/CDA1 family)
MRPDVPVMLAYHAVSDRWRSPLAVSPSAFAEQMGFFHRRGYAALTFAAAEDLRRNGTLPRKSLVISFDDAFASVLRALPLLDRYSWPATVFVVTEFATSGRPLQWHGLDGGGNPEGEREGLVWDQLRDLVECGWEIGSHTVSHPLLPMLPRAQVMDELARSRAEIARETGDCRTLAYPFGVANQEVAAIAKTAGYLSACTLRGTQLHDEQMLRPRLRLDSTHQGIRLRMAASDMNRRLRRSRPAHIASLSRGRRSWLPSESDGSQRPV